MTKRKIEYWVIPPEADAEFVANMENVLETYAQPYDPACPVICMDEQPVQLVKETRRPIPGTKECARRIDYEYERNGTASIFMFCEPLAAWRQATAREQRTKADWAQEVAALLDGRYADCERVVLVCDNLNTHTPGEDTTRTIAEEIASEHAERARKNRLMPKPDVEGSKHRGLANCRDEPPPEHEEPRHPPHHPKPRLHGDARKAPVA